LTQKSLAGTQIDQRIQQLVAASRVEDLFAEMNCWESALRRSSTGLSWLMKVGKLSMSATIKAEYVHLAGDIQAC
jgi:hypothetical protein